MGFFKSIKGGFTQGKHEKLFDLNSQKITLNFQHFASDRFGYGTLISNVSYLIAEQIKYTILPKLDAYKLNKISITVGFWLIVFIHIGKIKNIGSEDSESFEEFYYSVKDDYLDDFIDNNPTTDNKIHFREVLGKKFDSYNQNPLNTNELLNSNSLTYKADLNTKLKNDFYSTLSNDYGIRLMPENLDYLVNLFLQLFKLIDESLSKKYS